LRLLVVTLAVVLTAGVAGAGAHSSVETDVAPAVHSTVETDVAPAVPSTVGTDAALQNGTAGNVTVDTAFVGAVADEGTMTVEATGIVDDAGDPVDGEQVTVTVGGDPVTTATVQSGTLAATAEPSVLDLEPQDGAEVGIHGFEVTDPATVEIVHEVVALDAGYDPHSVPQGAELAVADVAAVTTWDPEAGSYESVTDPTLETPEDLHRALSLVATTDTARLGHTFETDGPPTPGEASLAPGWNFVGSNFDISTETAQTVQDDLFGIDATQYDIFAADFSEPLDATDTVGAYEGYWVFVDGDESVSRATLSPIYNSGDREEALDIVGSDFALTGVDVETNETGSGGLVEVSATVENQGDSRDTQFVDLLAESDTGGVETVARTGLELDAGNNDSLLFTYEVDETTEFDITVATDDDETTETVTWGQAFFVSNPSAPEQVDEGGQSPSVRPPRTSASPRTHRTCCADSTRSATSTARTWTLSWRC